MNPVALLGWSKITLCEVTFLLIDEPVDRLRVLLRAGPAQVWGEAQDPAFLTPGEAGAAGLQSTRGVRSQADGVQTVLKP